MIKLIDFFWYDSCDISREYLLTTRFKITITRLDINNNKSRLASNLKHLSGSCDVEISLQVVPTILPSGTVWDCKRGRLLLGIEQLSLQGIQFESPSILTNNQHQDLAGNAQLIFILDPGD